MKHKTVDKIKNKTSLLRELMRIAEVAERRNTRIFALALAYIITDICPDNRTTGYVEEKSHGRRG